MDTPPPSPEETREQRRGRLLGVVARLPEGPGVYLFRNAQGAVAYVGKARSLRDRVRSYFARRPGDTRRAVQFFERYVETIEFTSTPTEQDAFLLESKLVKRHKPAYNVKLRDDKDFLYVRVDRSHPFPALSLARRPRGKPRDVSFHGPFASAASLRHALRLLGSSVPLRDCSDREFAARTRPCLKHDMGRCSAPCTGLISRADYAALIEQALEVLSGRSERAVTALQQRMQAEAVAERYERAAHLRDQIRGLRAMAAPRGVENVPLPEADVVGLHRAGALAEVVVLFFRGGALVSSAAHSVESELPDDELLEGFLLDFYGEARPVPREILLPVTLPDADGLAAFLGTRRAAAPQVSAPRRGERRTAVELACRNAEHALAVAVEQRGHQHALLAALALRLSLPAPPEVIECYDVSNTGRTGIVASRIVFRHGEPDPSSYRTYRIRSVEGPDDYGSLGEVLRRRLARAATEPLPGPAGGGRRRRPAGRRPPRLRRGRLLHAAAGRPGQGWPPRPWPGARRGRARARLPPRPQRARRTRPRHARGISAAAPARRGAPLRHRRPPQGPQPREPGLAPRRRPRRRPRPAPPPAAGLRRLAGPRQGQPRRDRRREGRGPRSRAR